MLGEISSLTLSDSVSELRGVGPRYLKYLEKLGIKTVKDLLWHFPFRYEDFSQVKKINELQPNETCSIVATIKKVSLRRTFRKKMFIIEAKAEDDTGEINVIWFNQLYLIKTIPPGTTLSFSGKIKTRGKKLLLISPSHEIISREKLREDFFKELRHTGRLVPIYSETAGLSSRAIRYLIKPILKMPLGLKESLPFFILKKYNFPSLKPAFNEIHFPSSLEAAKRARERFIFESLLYSQLYLLKIKKKLGLLPYPKIEIDLTLLKSFVESLPFVLTSSQKKALWEIVQNMSNRLMNRLLEGEVGSGKTVIATAASLMAIKSGYQAALMAPTEILARQHFDKFKAFLKPFNVRLAILTSSGAKVFELGMEEKISKRALLKVINSSLPIVVIGTHALIQKNIQFSKLGLLIVDEQHRFGIEQRKKLIARNSQTMEIPHLLSLTATPIPRTLALVFYGDLDLSILNELPKGRKEIVTKIVLPKEKEKIYQFVRQEIKQGRQAFVICPRIEEKELSPMEVSASNLISLAEKLKFEVKAVKKEYKKLKEEIFPELEIAMLHGKMKPKEKEETMKRFKNNQINILVSTSVVEVGIDIPNAVIMLIEGAEHFGLAQLHQFRGRVGRAEHQSYCFLFSESSSPKITNRLKALVDCHDGFKLAEMDLSLRGPGEFFGAKQSGIPDLVMSSLINREFIENVSGEARNILKQDQTLKKWPELLAGFKEFIEKAHRE